MGANLDAAVTKHLEKQKRTRENGRMTKSGQL